MSARLTKWEQRALLHAASRVLADDWDDSLFDTEDESERTRAALETAQAKLLERGLW